MLDHHAPLGEGARLVRGQDAHGAKGFHGRQTADQGVAGCHPARSEREGECDHGGEGLRHCGDSQADGGHGHRAPREAACQAQGEEQHAQGDGDGRQDPAQ